MVTNGTLTAVPGFKVGHWTDSLNHAGCTVVLAPPETVATAVVMGSAPAEYNTARLDPRFGVSRLHAVLLTGSSIWGLPAVAGVQEWLSKKLTKEKEARTPQVAAAAVYNRRFARHLPSILAESAFSACENATENPVEQGNVGAGESTVSGKQFQGTRRGTKTGIGSFCLGIKVNEEMLFVGALVVLNANGSIIDPYAAQIIAGARTEAGDRLMSMDEITRELLGLEASSVGAPENTTLVVIATNAKFHKSSHLPHVAHMASAAIARTTAPAWTNQDGDMVFALSSGKVAFAEPNVIGQLAMEAATGAILNAALNATGADGLPGARDLQPVPFYIRPFPAGLLG